MKKKYQKLNMEVFYVTPATMFATSDPKVHYSSQSVSTDYDALSKERGSALDDDDTNGGMDWDIPF